MTQPFLTGIVVVSGHSTVCPKTASASAGRPAHDAVAQLVRGRAGLQLRLRLAAELVVEERRVLAPGLPTRPSSRRCSRPAGHRSRRAACRPWPGSRWSGSPPGTGASGSSGRVGAAADSELIVSGRHSGRSGQRPADDGRSDRDECGLESGHHQRNANTHATRRSCAADAGLPSVRRGDRGDRRGVGSRTACSQTQASGRGRLGDEVGSAPGAHHRLRHAKRSPCGRLGRPDDRDARPLAAAGRRAGSRRPSRAGQSPSARAVTHTRSSGAMSAASDHVHRRTHTEPGGRRERRDQVLARHGAARVRAMRTRRGPIGGALAARPPRRLGVRDQPARRVGRRRGRGQGEHGGTARRRRLRRARARWSRRPASGIMTARRRRNPVREGSHPAPRTSPCPGRCSRKERTRPAGPRCRTGPRRARRRARRRPRTPPSDEGAHDRLVAACARVGPSASRARTRSAASAKPSSGSTRLTTFQRSSVAAPIQLAGHDQLARAARCPARSRQPLRAAHRRRDADHAPRRGRSAPTRRPAARRWRARARTRRSGTARGRRTRRGTAAPRCGA